MGVVTEEPQEYMIPTVPHGGVVKNENECAHVNTRP